MDRRWSRRTGVKRWRRRLARGLVVGMLVGGLLSVASVAVAQGFGSSKVDRRHIDYYFSQVPYNWTLDTNWVRDNEIEPRASIVTSWTSSHSASEIGTLYRDWPNSGYVGKNINIDCETRSLGGGYHVVCSHQHIIYNKHYTEDVCSDCWDTTAERRSLACHEHGHGLGLSHTSNTFTCMRTGTSVHEDYTFSSSDDAAIDGFPLYQP